MLDRISLIRPIYRSLLNKGRTYAAFEKERIVPLVKELRGHKEIFDPTAGYGTLMTCCAELHLSSYGMEYNPPAYLWQVLIHPRNAELFLKLQEEVIINKKKWPKHRLKASVSEDWYHEESKRIILALFALCEQLIRKQKIDELRVRELSLAFLLPFVGRLSNTIPGNMVTHVKKGGMCVYESWEEDFNDYIKVLFQRLIAITESSKSKKHTIVFGDCRNAILPKERFSAMITSPPYPNSRDYGAMFGPENALLTWFSDQGIINNFRPNRLIGSVCVSVDQNSTYEKTPAVRSKAAKKFLSEIENFSGPLRANYDNKIYYLPYFSNYFHGLENAYANIAKSLKYYSKGYIIVVNNTARNQVIPVSESVIDIWRSLGFKAEIVKELTRELFHVGSINPRARGFKSVHTEHTVRVWRE